MREMAPCLSRVYLNKGASCVSVNVGTRAFPVLTTVKLLTFINIGNPNDVIAITCDKS